MERSEGKEISGALPGNLTTAFSIDGVIDTNHLELLRQILDIYPDITIIIDQNREIVMANQFLLDKIGMSNFGEILGEKTGEKPGETLNCIHATENKQGCGYSESCHYCGIVNSIRESQSCGIKVTQECRVTTRENNLLVSHDFLVSCSPLRLGSAKLTLVLLTDISGEKRNQMLENIFFHDILNRLGSLSGIIQVIRLENQQHELNEYLDVLDMIGELVIEDIQIQRFLKAAENESLILNLQEHDTPAILESVRKQIAFNPVLKAKQIEIVSRCENFTLTTDSALLKRILLNMVKNAAEAGREKTNIHMFCMRKKDTAIFGVNNAGTITDNIQKQIFQRSFSTKGPGRGLGTYSMKLFGENYLKGKVYFRSNEKQGTTFFIELPLHEKPSR